MRLKEIAIAGVWAASAVGVAGWTWQAYSEQYSNFPGPDFAGGDSTFDWESLLPGPVRSAINAVTGAVRSALAPIPPKVLKESPQGVAQARRHHVHPGPGR